MFKVALFVCAQALMIQSIAGRIIGSTPGAPWAAAPYAAAPLSGPYANGAYGPAAATCSHGGALPTSSASAIPPIGVDIASENYYEGPLSVAGTLPFLGTVALEGALPTAGSGTVAFSAGDGDVAMLAEDFAPARLAAPYGYRADSRAYDAPLARPNARSAFGF